LGQQLEIKDQVGCGMEVAQLRSLQPRRQGLCITRQDYQVNASRYEDAWGLAAVIASAP